MRVEITMEVMAMFLFCLFICLFPVVDCLHCDLGKELCPGEWHILNNGCPPGKVGPRDRGAGGSKSVGKD